MRAGLVCGCTLEYLSVQIFLLMFKCFNWLFSTQERRLINVVVPLPTFNSTNWIESTSSGTFFFNCNWNKPAFCLLISYFTVDITYLPSTSDALIWTTHVFKLCFYYYTPVKLRDYFLQCCMTNLSYFLAERVFFPCYK